MLILLLLLDYQCILLGTQIFVQTIDSVHKLHPGKQDVQSQKWLSIWYIN